MTFNRKKKKYGQYEAASTFNPQNIHDVISTKYKYFEICWKHIVNSTDRLKKTETCIIHTNCDLFFLTIFLPIDETYANRFLYSHIYHSWYTDNHSAHLTDIITKPTTGTKYIDFNWDPQRIRLPDVEQKLVMVLAIFNSFSIITRQSVKVSSSD